MVVGRTNVSASDMEKYVIDWTCQGKYSSDFARKYYLRYRIL